MSNELYEWEFGPCFGLAFMWERIEQNKWSIMVILPGGVLTLRLGDGWGRR